METAFTGLREEAGRNFAARYCRSNQHFDASLSRHSNIRVNSPRELLPLANRREIAFLLEERSLKRYKNTKGSGRAEPEPLATLTRLTLDADSYSG